MSTKKYILFPIKFPLHLKDWSKQQKALGKPGSQYEFAKQVGVDPYYVTDWKSGRHGTPYKYIERICEVLGVSPEVYEPKTHSEKYQYSSDFITTVGKANAAFAMQEGLNLKLVESLTEIVDFNKSFPKYSPLKARITPDFNAEYIRKTNVDSAPIDKDLQYLQIERDGKRLTLSRSDLAYLKEVQNKVAEYVEFLFYTRTQEMKDEVIRFNEGLHLTLKDGGHATINPTKEYLQKIDRFAKYDLQEDDNFEKGDES